MWSRGHYTNITGIQLPIGIHNGLPIDNGVCQINGRRTVVEEKFRLFLATYLLNDRFLVYSLEV